MKNIIWQGTADVEGFEHPMRVVEEADERLMTEWASATDNETGERVFDDSEWYADYQIRFRDMEPTPSDDLVARMKSQALLD